MKTCTNSSKIVVETRVQWVTCTTPAEINEMIYIDSNNPFGLTMAQILQFKAITFTHAVNFKKFLQTDG